MPEYPFTSSAPPPRRHTPATSGALTPRWLQTSAELCQGVTPEHTPYADSPGPRRPHVAEAPRGRVSSLLEVEGAFQSGNAQPLCGSHRLTPIPGVGGWGYEGDGEGQASLD